MGESKIIDQFAVESEYGIRSFNIYEGDIFDHGAELSLQERPLLVLSTHSS